jgi:hypothetical protein
VACGWEFLWLKCLNRPGVVRIRISRGRGHSVLNYWICCSGIYLAVDLQMHRATCDLAMATVKPRGLEQVEVLKAKGGERRFRSQMIE